MCTSCRSVSSSESVLVTACVTLAAQLLFKFTESRVALAHRLGRAGPGRRFQRTFENYVVMDTRGLFKFPGPVRVGGGPGPRRPYIVCSFDVRENTKIFMSSLAWDKAYDTPPLTRFN